MGVYKNTGSYPHRQYFWGNSDEDRPLNPDKGDKLTEIDTGKNYLFNGTSWVNEINNIQLNNENVSVINPVPVVSDISIATGGSQTTIEDTTKNFETDMFKNTIAEVTVGETTYFRTISGNTSDTITIATLPGDKACARLGSVEAGEVTIVCANAGVGGNEYEVEVVLSSGQNMELSASLTDLMLTVYLGTNAEGLADNSKNTATAIAAKIDEIAEFTATMTGAGGVIAVTENPIPFTGGTAIVSPSAGSKYRINENYTNITLMKSLIDVLTP